MEENTISAEKACSFCKEVMESPESIFCNHCGHPENGTDQQRAQYFAKRAIQKNKNIDAKSKIKSARNTLFILAGVIAIFGFVGYNSHGQVLILGIDLFLSIIYLTLGFWSEKKPMMALLMGLLLYITTFSILALVEPMTLVRGIIWKILIISYLGKGLYSASSIKNQVN